MNKRTTPIVREQDVILVRNHIRELCDAIGMNLINQTRLFTAASELVRNVLNYAGSGKVVMELVSINAKNGVKLTFTDEGPVSKTCRKPCRMVTPRAAAWTLACSAPNGW